jgi:hypothetical protein
MIFEHQTIKLMWANQRPQRIECKLVDLMLNLFIGKINVCIWIKYFNGWSKKGLNNQIGKIVGIKGGIFDLYKDAEIDV